MCLLDWGFTMYAPHGKGNLFVFCLCSAKHHETSRPGLDPLRTNCNRNANQNCRVKKADLIEIGRILRYDPRLFILSSRKLLKAKACNMNTVHTFTTFQRVIHVFTCGVC